jgi:hypothetical protein
MSKRFTESTLVRIVVAAAVLLSLGTGSAAAAVTAPAAGSGDVPAAALGTDGGDRLDYEDNVLDCTYLDLSIERNLQIWYSECI